MNENEKEKKRTAISETLLWYGLSFFLNQIGAHTKHWRLVARGPPPPRKSQIRTAALGGYTEFVCAFKSEGWSKRLLRSTAVLERAAQAGLRRHLVSAGTETTNHGKKISKDPGRAPLP